LKCDLINGDREILGIYMLDVIVTWQYSISAKYVLKFKYS